MGDFWVFGYGSLMWRPGFDHLGAVRAHLHGYHRALCVRSFVHRGAEQRPGLVLGLDKGGSCVGLAFRVEAGKREATVDYLRERELVTHVYKERLLRLRDHRITAGGVIVIKAQQSRSQEKNRALALEQLADLVRRVTVVPKKRRPTQPSRTAQEKRLANKKKRGAQKSLRGRVSDE